MLKLDPAKDGAIIVTTPQVIFTIVNKLKGNISE
jgi:hypothetical protein